MAEPYGTISDANSYFTNERVTNDAWINASDQRKLAALIESAEAIDRLNFVGVKTDPEQEREFPRNGALSVPDDIIKACYENAYGLLDGIDPEIEYRNLFMTHSSYASVRSSYDTTINRAHLQAGITSIKAWNYLQPYFADHQAISLKRV